MFDADHAFLVAEFYVLHRDIILEIDKGRRLSRHMEQRNGIGRIYRVAIRQRQIALEALVGRTNTGIQRVLPVRGTNHALPRRQRLSDKTIQAIIPNRFSSGMASQLDVRTPAARHTQCITGNPLPLAI